MNVLWKKGNLHKIFSKDSISLHAHASGDGGGDLSHCCRLCGGENSLRSFGDTYVWEGVEERYDQLLYDCFGVRVSIPSDSMICEWCVRQLRNTERFRALVHAAFDKPLSEDSSKTLNPETLKLDSEIYNIIESTINDQSTTANKSTDNNKSIRELLNGIVIDSPKKREIRRKIINVKPNCKRINISCTICKQKYPMMVPANGLCKTFVCSRCKKGEQKSVPKKCNVAMPTNIKREHTTEAHVKPDLRGKCRVRILPKKPQQVKNGECVQNRYLTKNQCSQYPTKNVLAPAPGNTHKERLWR